MALADVLKTRLTPDDVKRLKKSRWLDRLTSLWAPISIFGIAFAIYLFIVELNVCAYPALQPFLQGFGLIMLVYYFALVGMRGVARPFIQARKARNVAEELITEVEQTAASKGGAPLQPKAIEDLADRLVALVRALGARDPVAVKESTTALADAADRHFKKGKRGGARDFAGGFTTALLVALLIRTAVVEPFKIPSGSMIPTLEIGDQIFVNKFIYGVRIPFLNKIPFTLVREPLKGDVIVFDNRLVGKDFIKRIVATPGDRIEVHDAVIKVNGVELPTDVENASYESWEMPNCELGFVACIPSWFQNDWRPVRSSLSRERLEGRPHYILNRAFPNSSDIDTTVPPRSVFVMGDNRDNSEDSRFGLGGGKHLGVQFVPYDDIKGKATVIWLSLSHEGLFSSFFGGTGIRGDRFFRSVSMCGSEAKR
ncbi:MAG: signal peptidase I [Myxococcaceae bacterium]|nr:signal peptidase I [Myxococcaceae bacterium]